MESSDLEFLGELQQYTNVLPIVAKADTFTPHEMQRCKNRVIELCEMLHISLFDVEGALTATARQ